MSFAAADLRPPFERPVSRVAIRRAANYEVDLQEILSRSLREFDLPVRGKTVLLKPNFVEPDADCVINTHPALVAAARESFLRLGAARVLIGEGPGHERDTQGNPRNHKASRLCRPLGRRVRGPECRRSGAGEHPNARLKIEAAVSLEDNFGRGFRRVHAENEDASLGGSDTFAEKHVWDSPGKLLRLAEERTSLGRADALDPGHQQHGAAGFRHCGWDRGNGGQWADPGNRETVRHGGDGRRSGGGGCHAARG